MALIFILCSIVKHIEFFYIQTDRTFIADNVICKIFTIISIAAALIFWKLKPSDIGFRSKGFLKYMCCGFGLGIGTFAVSYGLEVLILILQGKTVTFGFYVTNFALSGATNSVELSVPALLICIAGNVINVVAEEGLFRGLFLFLFAKIYSFGKSNLIQAFLFGIWHLVTVALEVKEGTMNIPTAIVMAIGYIVLAGILALEWGTCVDMTGVLWVGMFEHFFNNFIGNTLHVVSSTGTDEMQIVRIVLSNILSLTVVLLINKRSRKKIREEL